MFVCFLMCMCPCVSLCALCACRSQRRPEEAMAALELELQEAASRMWVLEPSLGPLQEQPVHLTTAPFLQPPEKSSRDKTLLPAISQEAWRQFAQQRSQPAWTSNPPTLCCWGTHVGPKHSSPAGLDLLLASALLDF